jgi:hypothetical protein
MTVAEGKRPPTLPDAIWAEARPVFRRCLDEIQAISGKELAAGIGLSGPSVSSWFNGHTRPNETNLRLAMRFIRENCNDAEVQRGVSRVLGMIGDTLAAAELAAQKLTRDQGISPDEAWLLMRNLTGTNADVLYYEALARRRPGSNVSKEHSDVVGKMQSPPPPGDGIETS